MKSVHLISTGLCALLSFYCPSATAQTSKKNSPLGKTDIHALLEAAPAVPASVQMAVSRAYGPDIIQIDASSLENYYKPLYAKVEAAQMQFGSYRIDLQNAYQEQQEKQIRKQSQVPATPAMGGEMPGMKAFTQKYMSDKAFAERYNNMTEAQQGAVIREFMEAEKAGSSTEAVPTNYGKFEKELKDKNKVQVAMKIQEAMSDMQIRISKLTEDYENKVKLLGTDPGNFDELRKAYDKAYREIPLVVMGEGRDKDPVALKALIAKDVAANRARNEMELSKKAAWFTDLKAKFKLIVSDYKDLLQKYGGSINGSVKDLNNGTNTELGLLDFEASLMGLASQLGKYSEEATERAASKEREQYFRTRP